MASDERRRYPRLAVPIFYRSPRLFAPRKPARDISLGGARVYTDSALEIGQRLEIELFLPDGSSLNVDVRVSWLRKLEANSFAEYEAGFEFLGLDEERAAILSECVQKSQSDFPSGVPPAR